MSPTNQSAPQERSPRTVTSEQNQYVSVVPDKSHLQSSAVPFQADKDPYAPSKDPYKRLLRRNTRQSVSNRSHPIAVADFDLHERGLIVFGLDEADSHGGNLGGRGIDSRDKGWFRPSRCLGSRQGVLRRQRLEDLLLHE